jgi:TonB family protein
MSYQALLFCQDEKTARTVTQVLSELEFQVDACAETFGAVKKLTSQAFDAVVVDCQGEENASLLLKTARNSSSNATSLMVALVDGQAGVAAAFRIGANLVLTKPIAVEQARGTLRVARGLLRKNAGVAASAASSASAPVPVSAAAPPKPTIAAAAGVQGPAPTSKPDRPPAPLPTSLPARPASNPLPAQGRGVPVSPSALRAVASSSNLEFEAEIQPQPDPASAGLLEAMKSKTFDRGGAPSASNSAAEIVTVSELKDGANEAVRAALSPRPPMSSQEFSAGFSSAAAVAPAKETEATAAVMPAKVADLFEAPEFGQVNETSANAVVPYNAEIDLSGSPAERRSKMPLVAVAAVVIAGALYFGWTQTHKTSVSNSAVSGPLQPPPPDFGGSDATAHPRPSTASHTAAPAAAADSGTSEPINRFARQQPIADDQVTTPIAVVTPHSAPAQTPLRVKTELARPAGSIGDAGEAPAIASLGAAGKPDALTAITRSGGTPLPAAPGSQRVSQGVSDGQLIKKVQPVYPQQALQMRIQGTVALQATVGKDGSVRSVKVVSGPATLSRAASDAVKQWKYRPFLLNGEPVETQTEINIKFVPPR